MDLERQYIYDISWTFINLYKIMLREGILALEDEINEASTKIFGLKYALTAFVDGIDHKTCMKIFEAHSREVINRKDEGVNWKRLWLFQQELMDVFFLHNHERFLAAYDKNVKGILIRNSEKLNKVFNSLDLFIEQTIIDFYDEDFNDIIVPLKFVI